MTVAQGYIGRSPGEGRTIIGKQTTSVTAGVQTSFTITQGYDLGYLEVYLNGTKQVETLDFTADDGSTVSFSVSTPPVQGDTLEFVAYKNFNVSNVTGSIRDFTVGRNLDVTGNVTIGSSLTIASDLVVNGTYTYVNTEILDIEDKTVGIASTSSASNTTADGAGIVVYGGSDGDKSLLWGKTKSNWTLAGGGLSIGTGVTLSVPSSNVLGFSVDGAEKMRLNNYGALCIGLDGEAWGSAYKTVQAGCGAFFGNAPAASAASGWTNNAYYDSVNSRWEYIAADQASRLAQGDGDLAYYTASAGSADGAITWNERIRVKESGYVGIGTGSPNHPLDVCTSAGFAMLGGGSVELVRFDGAPIVDFKTSAAEDADCRIAQASNGFAFSVGGNGSLAEAIRIKSTGDFGVGTAAPTARLDVRRGDTDGLIAEFHQSTGYGIDIGSSTALAYISSGYNQDWAFKSDAGSGQVERLRITKAGRVGINTTIPESLLEIKGDSSNEAKITFNRQPVQGTNDGIIGELFFQNATDSVAQISVKRESAADDAYIQFATQTTGGSFGERLRIDSSGRVLIGTTTEGYNGGDDLTISTSGDTGMTIRSGTSGQGTIAFSDATSGAAEYRGYIQYHHNGDHMLFGTASTERLRITSAGTVLIGLTSAEDAGCQLEVKDSPATARLCNSVDGHYFESQCSNNNDGFQVYQQHGSNTTRNTFATYDNRTGSKSASFTVRGDGLVTCGGAISFNNEVGTANQLDDYEEGTWTPSWSNATTGGTSADGSNNHGRYIKIGKMVTAIFYTWGLQSVGNSDAMIMQGFPFATAEMSEYWGACQTGFFNMGADSYYNLGIALHGSSVSYGYLQFSRHSSGDATPATFNGIINGYTNFTGTITYITS